jgi:hypothetical protein
MQEALVDCIKIRNNVKIIKDKNLKKIVRNF